MAKATKASLGYKVVLELSGEEAETLRAVLYWVGGNPDNSRRFFINHVDSALINVGVPVYDRDIERGSSVIFTETNQEKNRSEWV